jgi:hypothetical protein
MAVDTASKMTNLFEPIVPEDQLHPSFRVLRGSAGHIGARALMNSLFSEFKDTDGNFLEQFQSYTIHGTHLPARADPCLRPRGPVTRQGW